MMTDTPPPMVDQLGRLALDAMTELLTRGPTARSAAVLFDIAGEDFVLIASRDLQDAGPDDFPTRKHEDSAKINERLCAIADQVVPAYRAEGASYSCTGHIAHKWNAAYEGAARALGVEIVLSGRKLEARPHQQEEQAPHFDMVESVDGVRMVALDTWQRNNVATFLRLQLEATNDVTEEQVAAWSDEQCKEADVWACSVHLNASDNDDVIVPKRPAFIPYQATDPRRPLAPGEIRLGPGQLNYVDLGTGSDAITEADLSH